ncbi:MAG: hypothetical protein V4649_04240 [Bacteroidota bacterium]
MRYILSVVCLTVLSLSANAQMDKEEKQDRKAASQQKVDYNLFRRQMLTLKEYSDERRKMAELQKTTKDQVKLVAYVDSTNEADDSKTLVGYIRENVGENSTDLYEVTYDRSLKKIIFVKATGETVELDEERAKGKPGTKKPAAKKSKDDEDDEDNPAPAPKRKQVDDEDE